MSYSHILLERAGGAVAMLTVNRPQRLNVLDRQTITELEDALAEVENDAGMRGLLLTGAGERAFVSGADIQELAQATPLECRNLSLRGQRVFRRLETMGKPSVAAINGFALGGGLELALAATIRVASEDARLGFPEVKLGLVPGYGGTQRLPRLIGRGPALEMLLTGEPVGAAEAYRIGLVNHVVAAGELLDFSRQLLDGILANGPVAVALAMEAVDVGLTSGLEAGLRFEAAAFAAVASSEDRIEGTRAFLEKRRPVFQGK